MKKTKYLAFIAAGSLAFSGCANKKESVVEKPDPTVKRVHTQEQLKKTGSTQPGPALEKVDPAVQSSRQP